ncbi:MAG TPA: cupin domain-containing protein [Solirubrobacterales bacterium]|nr:cupin domain-containing protein [Solirubrobacterales bacterium]
MEASGGDQTSRRGQVLTNPSTGERVVMLTDPEVHPEGVLVAHLYVEPGGRVAAAHRHPTITERFHVLEGEVGFLLGDRERTFGPGEEAVVPAGTLHDWWQVGEETAQVVVEVDPGDRFVEMVGTFFGLARDGKADRRGLPRPLQLAVTAQAYRDVMVIASPPTWVQSLAFGILAPLGRALGRRPSYPEYLTSTTVVEPDPAALALLDESGRMRSSG